MTKTAFDEDTGSYTIALQPIVDSELNHVADELLYRGHFKAREASIDNDVQATARACAIAIYEVGLDRLCGRRKLFINVSEQWLLNPDLHSLPADRVVLEILESTRPTEEVKQALEKLKTRGYTLAIDDFQTDQNHESLLPYCDIVKLDVSSGVSVELVESLKARNVTLLAERVETREEFEQFKALGVTLFQGYFYERPTTRKTRETRRSSSKAHQLRLLSTLMRSDIDLSDVSSLVAQDPYLIDTVLRRANAASKGLAQPCYKLNTCIQRLGLQELRMLVTVVLLADNNPVNKLNLIKGLTRALVCQRLAEQREMNEEEGFILGLFSHMPIILDIELETLMEELPLGSDFSDALIEREGMLGALLDEVESVEKGGASSSVPDILLVKAAAHARALVDYA